MKKRNLWNRMFYSDVLEEELDTYSKCLAIKGIYPEIQGKLQRATKLSDLLEIHKFAWQWGFRNENLAPCSYGMFRTGDIKDMTLSEIYLGNIYGLCTKPASEWDKCKENMTGNGFGIDEFILCKDLIFKQYKDLLSSNFRSLANKANSYVWDYESVNPKEEHWLW